jgi:hypothetical protein
MALVQCPINLDLLGMDALRDRDFIFSLFVSLWKRHGEVRIHAFAH